MIFGTLSSNPLLRCEPVHVVRDSNFIINNFFFFHKSVDINYFTGEPVHDLRNRFVTVNRFMPSCFICYSQNLIWCWTNTQIKCRSASRMALLAERNA